MCRLAAIALVVGLAACAYAGRSPTKSSPAKSLPANANESDLRAKQAEQRQEAAQVRAKVTQLKKKQAVVTVQLQASQQKLELTAEELKRFNTDLRATAKNLVVTRQKCDQLTREMSVQLDELTDLLVAYYRNGRNRYTQALVTSNDLGDFMNRAELVRRIVDSDNELIHDTEQRQQRIKQHEAELRQHKQRTEQLRVMVADKREELSDTAHVQRQLLGKISRERSTYEQYLRELESSSREIERLIRRMKAERERARRAKATPDAPDEPPSEFVGSFIRPVAGIMRSGFGVRTHPIFRIRKLHTGVDLAAPSGTPVKAAADGVVILAGWKGGYGKTVVIDHGGDTATLYGHCSTLLVTVGNTVRRGQTIARVGSTGYSTGPHLHWEVRKNGVPVNPLAQ